MDLLTELRADSYIIPVKLRHAAAAEIERLQNVIEDIVRLTLERAIKLEMSGLTENGSRLNPTAYQWRTIANDLRAIAKVLPTETET